MGHVPISRAAFNRGSGNPARAAPFGDADAEIIARSLHPVLAASFLADDRMIMALAMGRRRGTLSSGPG